MKKEVDVIVLDDWEKTARYAAESIASEINCKKKFNLGLASGETMIPVYKELVKLYREKRVNFANVETFNLDEYPNVKKEDSFEYFLEKHFLDKVNLKKENQHFLQEKNLGDYEKLIKKAGGIDLCILGIGRNGHIAFNEPGSGFKSRTRKIKLREETRRVNKKFFKSLKETPKEALTVGVGTILDARKVLLVAFGSEKSQAICESLNARARLQWPASALQLHPNVKFVLDKQAGSKLRELR